MSEGATCLVSATRETHDGISHYVGDCSEMCIPASSAQSERDFSSVGHTVTDKRSRLNENTVEALKFLRWGMRAELISNQ